MSQSGKLLWIALLVIVPLGLLWEYYPIGDATARLNKLPFNNGRVESKDIPMSPAEEAIFSSVSVVKRLAVSDEGKAVVTIIDGTPQPARGA